MSLSLPPAGQISLYLLQFLLVAWGLGSLTLHLPRMLPMPRLARFLVGFTLTPYALGAAVSILGSLIPGRPAWLFYWLPLVLAAVPALYFGRRTFHRLRRSVLRSRRQAAAPYLSLAVVAISLGLVTIVLLPALWVNGWAPIAGHDALLYSSKASNFAELRDTSIIYGLRGDPQGTAREDSHGVLYAAYLGHAMLTQVNGNAGPPNDYAVRFAFQVTLPLMLLAIVALATTYRQFGVGALAVIFILMVGRFEYVSFQSSRDGFRLIPILLYSTLLIGLSPGRLRSRVHPSVLVPLLLLPVAALYGHTLGGIIAAICTVVWVVSSVIQRAPVRFILLLSAVIGVGFALGSLRYFELYLAEGLIQGYASVESTVKGTDLAAILQANRRQIVQTGLMERLALPFTIDSFRVSLAGIAASFASLVWWWRTRSRQHSWVFLLLGLTVLAIFLPLTGLLDYSGYRISRSFVRNERYTLHWYPYAAICLAGLLLTWHQVWARRPSSARAANIAMAAVTLAATIVAAQTLNQEWRLRSAAHGAGIAEVIAPAQVMLQQIKPPERWLLDDDRYNYNLGNEGLVMYTRATWPVVKAQDPQEARRALDDLNIGAVALLRRDIDNWWGRLPFFTVLSDPKEAIVLSGSSYLVFDRVESTADYSQVLSSYLAAAESSGPAALFGPEQVLPAEIPASAQRAAVLALAPGVSLALADAQYAVTALTEAVDTDPLDPSLHMALGHLYSALGNPVAAYNHYSQAREHGGAAHLVQRYMAAAKAREAEQLAAQWQYPAAIEAFHAAIALAPDEPLVNNLLLAAHNSWGAYFDEELMTAMLQPYLQAVRAADADAGDYLALAQRFVALEEPQAALDTYQDAFERWPDDDVVLQALAAESLAQHDSDRAAMAYEKMIGRNPQDPNLYRQLAGVYLAQRQAQGAIAVYRQAVEANPGAAWPHLELGRLYQMQLAELR